MKLDLTQRGTGVVLRIQAVPGARRNGILGLRNRALRVAVTQVAEKGKANQALIAVLAKQFGLRKSQIAIIAGEASSQKQLYIDAITAAGLQQQIEQIVQSASG